MAGLARDPPPLNPPIAAADSTAGCGAPPPPVSLSFSSLAVSGTFTTGLTGTAVAVDVSAGGDLVVVADPEVVVALAEDVPGEDLGGDPGEVVV